MIGAWSVVQAIGFWFAVAVVVGVVGRVVRWWACRESEERFRACAAAIDDGDPCLCCGGVWSKTSDDIVSVNGPEVRLREVWQIKHAVWCDYAAWIAA